MPRNPYQDWTNEECENAIGVLTDLEQNALNHSDTWGEQLSRSEADKCASEAQLLQSEFDRRQSK